MRCTGLGPVNLEFDGFKHLAVAGIALYLPQLDTDATIALSLYSSVAVEAPEVGYSYRAVVHDFKVEVNSHTGNFDSASISGNVSYNVYCDRQTGVIDSQISHISSYPSPPGELVGLIKLRDNLGNVKYHVRATIEPDPAAAGGTVATSVWARIEIYDFVEHEHFAAFDLPPEIPLQVMNNFRSRLA